MANLHLVTGYAGYEHIKATDQAAFNAALIGTGQFVLEKGGIFEAQVQTNNLVRVLDGELMMQGRFIRLDPDTYVDLEIENGEQGKLRNDIIVARYTKDIGTGVEECNLVVIKGESVASNPVDPAHEEGDITNGVATVHDFPLWRIPIDGINVGEPESLFGTPFMDSMHTLHSIRVDVDAQLAEQEAQYEAAFEEQNTAFQEAVDAFGGYTKAETLTDETKALYGKDDSAVPNDVFAFVKEALDGKMEIISGSYVGTGTYGQTSKNTLTFDAVPQFLIIFQSDAGGFAYGVSSSVVYTKGIMVVNGTPNLNVGGSNTSGSSYNGKCYFTWDNENKVVSWYGYYNATGDLVKTGTPHIQHNASGVTYKYMAIVQRGMTHENN